jgi:hypothetical protein
MLDAYLANRGIEYGSDQNRWTASAASELAADLDAEFMAEHNQRLAEELDAQEARVEDDDLPDHLKRLAGVPAGETAEPVEA